MNGSVIKRFELIKNAIALEDEEIIVMQIERLDSGEVDESTDAIIEALQMHRYDKAMLQIESYIKCNSGVIVYDDPELQGLRLELKVLERRLQEFDGQKNEYLQLIGDFNTEYNLRLGALIEQILLVKREIAETIREQKARTIRLMEERREKLKRRLEETQRKKKELARRLEDADEEDFDEILEELKQTRQEYSNLEEEIEEESHSHREAEKDFAEEEEQCRNAEEEHENFKETFEEELENRPFELDEEQQAKLKKLYRQATKLCHPDIVVDVLKQQAEKIIKCLNNAYARKDLAEVKEILLSLENGTGFDVASDIIVDLDRMRAKVEELRAKVETLEQEIEEITGDKTCRLIREIDNWNDYFNKTAEQLQEELNKLENVLMAEQARDVLEGYEDIFDVNFARLYQVDPEPDFEESFWDSTKTDSEKCEAFAGGDDYWNEKF